MMNTVQSRTAAMATAVALLLSAAASLQPAGAQTLATLASQPASKTATKPSASDELAADSLRHWAMEMAYAPRNTPARAGRLMALAQMSDALVPQDPRTAWILANIFETQGKPSGAAAALAICLQASPQDHSLGLAWLKQSLLVCEDSGERVSLLKSVAQSDRWPAPLKAQAYALWAELAIAQGDVAQAKDLYKQALTLDALQPVALNAVMSSGGNLPVERRVQTLLCLLRGNPASIPTAWDLGDTLDALGLYEPSVQFFQHAWDVIQYRKHEGQPGEVQDLLAQYFSATLDAAAVKDSKADFAKAIEIFEPLAKKYPDSMDLQSLLMEACRVNGDKDKVTRIFKEMDAHYDKQRKDPRNEGIHAEVAWFNLIGRPYPAAAFNDAVKAMQKHPDNPVVSRIYGAAQIVSDDEKVQAEGAARLAPLAAKDPYAAAFLAQHYLKNGDQTAARKALSEGLSTGCNGPGFRRLLEIAREAKIEPAKLNITSRPAAETLDKVAALLKDFDARALQMAMVPEKFAAVTMRVLRDHVAVGEPIEVEVTLKNVGELNLPLGDWGLLSPVVSLSVMGKDWKEPMSNLPLAVLPAPRYLEPGKSVKTTVRLDVGGLSNYLVRRPLEDVTLTITATVDPVQRGQSMISSVPTVKVEPATVTRDGLLGKVNLADKTVATPAYQDKLKELGKTAASGELPRRMLAARQMGSLATYCSLSQVNLAETFKGIPDLDKVALLKLVETCVADKDPAVRAEMIAGLETMPYTSRIMPMMNARISDESAVVRLRVLELLGSMSNVVPAEMLEFYSKDPNPCVRLLAVAFGSKK